MATVKKGDKVKLHYIGKLADGTVFDSSRERGEPFNFVVGKGMVISGFEDGVVGMKTGDKKTLDISPEKGYGHRNEELVMEIPRSHLPPDIKPKAGNMMKIPTREGQIIEVQITRVDQKAIEVDANHPLAGKTLIFELELIDIQ